MIIRLSASSIKDFVKCSKMFYFRNTIPEEAFNTQEASVGTICHKLIEKHWDGSDFTADKEKLLLEYAVDSAGAERLNKCLNNFNSGTFDFLRSRFSEEDKREFYFQEKIDSEVTISGRMDYIINKNNIVIDWKTGATKKNLSNDIQFIIYYTMYNKIFGRYPAVYQASLLKNECDLFMPRQEYIDVLYDEIIPNILLAVSTKGYFREGYFNGACYNCNFIASCSKRD